MPLVIMTHGTTEGAASAAVAEIDKVAADPPRQRPHAGSWNSVGVRHPF